MLRLDGFHSDDFGPVRWCRPLQPGSFSLTVTAETCTSSVRPHAGADPETNYCIHDTTQALLPTRNKNDQTSMVGAAAPLQSKPFNELSNQPINRPTIQPINPLTNQPLRKKRDGFELPYP